jgi:hypothetical protein
MRVKCCAYVCSVETLLNPCSVATVSYKYSLKAARQTVIVAVPCTVRYPANYKIKVYYFR